MNKNRGVYPLIIIIIGLGNVILSGCHNADEKQNISIRKPEVIIITIKSTSLKITNDLPGRVSSFRVAQIRPQVSGIIIKQNFIEGSEIKAGMSLYQIDPAIYKATYLKAKSILDQAESNAKISSLTVTRYKNLLNNKYISQQDYDTALANQRYAIATVHAAQASLKIAQINLSYTTVKSPISGLIGISSVTEGALVQNLQTTPLATVQQIDPIYITITQSSEDFLHLRNKLNNGTLQPIKSKLRVKLLGRNNKEYPYYGILEITDITVNETTNAITLRAVFPNTEHMLLPGMFVRARVDAGTKLNAILVPQEAIMHTPNGKDIVMILTTNNKIKIQNVIIDQAIGNKWLVTEGLTNGDRVVLTGLQHVKIGTVVNPQEVKEAKF